MPRIKPLHIDNRIVILKTAEARQGYRNHSDMARHTGMAVSTINKRFREPGSITLDELARMTRGSLTAEEALQLIGGGRR